MVEKYTVQKWKPWVWCRKTIIKKEWWALLIELNWACDDDRRAECVELLLGFCARKLLRLCSSARTPWISRAYLGQWCWCCQTLRMQTPTVDMVHRFSLARIRRKNADASAKRVPDDGNFRQRVVVRRGTGSRCSKNFCSDGRVCCFSYAWIFMVSVVTRALKVCRCELASLVARGFDDASETARSERVSFASALDEHRWIFFALRALAECSALRRRARLRSYVSAQGCLVCVYSRFESLLCCLGSGGMMRSTTLCFRV